MKEFIRLERRYRIKDIIIILFIVISPFLFFLYNLIPKDLLFIETYYIRIESGFYERIATAFWHINLKLLNLSIFTIWFLTCRHWWRYAILIPFLFEIIKLVGVFNEMKNISTIKLFQVLPFVLISFFLILFFSKKLNYYSLKKSLNNELSIEIDDLMQSLSKFKSKNYKGFKIKYSELLEKKESLNKKEYLKQLIQLREEFTSQSK